MFKVSQEIRLKENDSANHSTLYGNYRTIPNEELPIFKSDASQMKYSGTGLTKAKIDALNEFTIDASDAGTNILFIGICGPKGQCDEVAVKHLGSNLYNVSYKVQDFGRYVIAVKWGDDHIPNSPFFIDVN